MRTAFVLITAFLAFSCANGKTGQASVSPHDVLLPPQYYFYPKANVYFDSANKDYLFQVSNDTGWTTQKQIPAAVQALMDKSVLLQNAAQPVWKDNANHRLIYSAVLYASPSDTVEKKEPPPVIKVDTIKKKEERKSGIRRFFSRLFGKKDKKKK